MHYKNGREAKNGDKVLLMRSYGPPMIGILYDAVAGNNDCNGKIAAVNVGDPCHDLKECLHFDDVKATLGNLSTVLNSSAVVTGPRSARPDLARALEVLMSAGYVAAADAARSAIDAVPPVQLAE